MMEILKKSMMLLVFFALPVIADPATDVPQVVKSDDAKELTIDQTFAQVAEILESAFGAMASVRDDKSLAESGAKLENLAKEMLAIEADVDMTKKPNDKQIKEVALRFLRMEEKVKKQMEEVGKLKLSDEITNGRDEQFMKFMKAVDPMKQKMNTLFPPAKLSYFVDQIKAQDAARARNNKGENP
jgi:hypothetical protein